MSSKVGSIAVKLIPFFAVLFIYESFRGLADNINPRIEYLWMPDVDKLLFGFLPTIWLQNWLWHGNLTILDYAFYVPYMLHFVLPALLVIYVLIKIPKRYFEVVLGFVLAAFVSFIGYILFPSAPPWMASDMGYIESLHRISINIWASFGINNFSQVYDMASPNSVAAVPSRHAAWATLIALYTTSIFSNKYRYLIWVYPALIYIGTVYMGEHYVIDIILGIIVAVSCYFASRYAAPKIKKMLSQRL